MTLLAIETTGPICSAALRAADGRICARAEREGLRHLTSLLPMVQALLDETGTAKSALTAIAVSAGPGSFTGIRIGVATARAVAQTLDIPIIRVPTLETFAFLDASQGDGSGGMGSRATGTVPLARVVCPVFDARRAQMYAGAYVREENDRVMTLVPAAAWNPPDYFAALDAALAAYARLLKNNNRGVGGEKHGKNASPELLVSFMGDGVPVFQTKIEAWQESRKNGLVGAEDRPDDPADADSQTDGILPAAPVATESLPGTVQDARAVLAWAEALGRLAPYEALEPIYLRKAEAQRKLDECIGRGTAGESGSGETANEPSAGASGISMHPSRSTGYSGVIRPAEERDVYGISVVERLSFREPWLEQSIRDDLGLDYGDTVVYERDGLILGYAGLHRIGNEADITNVATHPAARRQGIAAAVLRVLLARAETLGVSDFALEVRESDKGAIALYEGLGFRREGRRVSYYPAENGKREDALILWKRGAAKL